MTAAEALRDAAARLAAAGIEGGARDARLLLAEALGLAPNRLTLHLPDTVGPEAAARFEAFLGERLRRRPVAQILGRRMFWGRAFRVTADTLDPRPETETLIEAALAAPFASVLDLGTGTGCILLTLLAERPQARGIGTDASAAALAVAEDNARGLGLADRAGFRRADWFDGVEGRFDLVVSNPPYIAESEMADLAPDVRDWEPALALTPGGDGLDAYRAITAGAARHLTPGGRLLLEIGATQGPAVAALCREAGLGEVGIRPDLDGRDRVVVARCR